MEQSPNQRTYVSFQGPACSLTPAPGPEETLEPYEFDGDGQDYPTYSFNDEIRSSIFGSLASNTSTAVSTTSVSTPTPSTDPEPTEPDWDSDACKACSTNLGASECSADDDQCLIDQCKADSDCTECGANCETDFISEEEDEEPTPDPEPEPEPTEPDWESEACRACSDNMGASSCSADDDQCLIDQCKADSDCTECGANCETDFISDEEDQTTPEPTEPDWDSDACRACSDNLGASSCSADDDQCLIDQCKGHSDCSACGADCETDFTGGG